MTPEARQLIREIDEIDKELEDVTAKLKERRKAKMDLLGLTEFKLKSVRKVLAEEAAATKKKKK